MLVFMVIFLHILQLLNATIYQCCHINSINFNCIVWNDLMQGAEPANHAGEFIK